MNKLFSRSIKSQLFVMVFIMAFFTAGIIVYSGISFRNEKISEALKDSSMLADNLSKEHQKMVADARQLTLTLAQLSEIGYHNAAGMQPILKEVLRANPKYSNIFIANRAGRVVASAVPVKDTNVSDRRYFINALASGRFSSGEYTISRFTGKSVLPFAYPFKDKRGEILGVIVMGIDLTHYRTLLDTLQLPSGSSYLLLDHKGTIMTRGINPADFAGEQYNAAAFRRMAEGPDKDTFVAVAHDGIKRFISYRKIQLEGEQRPYMYIRSGIPVAAALSVAHRTLVRNLVLFTVSLCFVVVFILLIAKHSILDRIALLEMASKRLADGDLHVKVSNLVSGGELGRLGLTFDHMANQINLREEAKDRLLKAISAATEGIAITDDEDRFVYVNDAHARIYGRLQDELIGKTWRDTVTPELGALIERDLPKTLHNRAVGVWSGECPALRKDGTILPTEIAATSRWDETGKYLGHICIVRDISERKRSEETLINKEKFIRNILDTVDEGFIVIDSDYHILTANKAYCNQVSMPCDEVGGRYCYELSHKTLRPCYEEGEECAVRQVFETGEPHSALHKHPDAKGSVLYVETKAFPIKDSSGEVTSVIGVINNITGKHLLEEEQLKTQKLEAIGLLAGGIAHDFNNLLQGVFGYISMARIMHDQKQKSIEMLEEAEKALNMSVNLTSQLLTFSKGGKPLTKRIELRPVIENSVKFALSGSSVDCRINIDEDLRTVEVDEGQISQVIQNLVLNAQQAMPIGGTISIAAWNIVPGQKQLPLVLKQGNYVVISIMDRGIGIPEQYLTKIFDPYFTTKDKGSGLGLATSYSIIKNHGGVIDVKSKLGEGTTFFVYLPAVAAVESSAKTVSGNVQAIRKGRILLMDDEEIVRDIVGIMIKSLGHEAEFAVDGKEAIGKYRESMKSGRKFDIVIMDLTVRGGMGGEEAIKELREIDPDIKAIVSSGYTDSSAISQYKAAGFKSCLTKPYDIDSLNTTLNSLLD